MTLQFAFRHMPSSEALKEYAESKILRSLSRMQDQPIMTRVVFSVEGGEHISHCDVQTKMGNNLHVNQKSTNMYESVDRMIDKLDAQMRKLKKDKSSSQRIAKHDRWQVEVEEEEKEQELN